MGLNDNTRKVFKERFAALRRERGWSQPQLAMMVECTPSEISHYETGARTPHIGRLRALCEALGTSSDYMLGMSNVPTKVIDIVQEDDPRKWEENSPGMQRARANGGR